MSDALVNQTDKEIEEEEDDEVMWEEHEDEDNDDGEIFAFMTVTDLQNIEVNLANSSFANGRMATSD